MKKEEKSWGQGIAVAVLFFLVIIGLCFILRISYNANVVLNEKEIPPTTQNCQNEQITWNLPDSCLGYEAFNASTICLYSNCKITNTDEVGGNFRLEFSASERWTLSSGGETVTNPGKYPKEVYIEAGETKVIREVVKCWTREDGPTLENIQVLVVPPTKRVC
jgi:hypothetical protein